MSSSTSSSSGYLSWRVVAALLGALFAFSEAAARLGAVPVSGDVQRMRAIPGDGAALVRFDGPRVALVGNSATRMGVDSDRLRAELTRLLGRAADVRVFYADGSRATVWRYMLERGFWADRRSPDLIVVVIPPGFVVGEEPEPGALLAQALATPADWPEIFSDHLRDLSSRSEFLASYASTLFASRMRARDRALHLAVPGYELFTLRVSRANREHERVRAETLASRGPRGSTRQVAVGLPVLALLHRARQVGARVLFVRYPDLDRKGRDLPEMTAARRAIESAGFEWLDFGAAPALTADRFDADRFHMNDSGKALFSRMIAEAVAARIGSASTAPQAPE